MKIASLIVCLILIISIGSSTAQNLIEDNNNIYISPQGSDMGDGSISKPFRSLTKAVSVVNDNGTIHIANGIYTDNNLEINKNMNKLRILTFLVRVKKL